MQKQRRKRNTYVRFPGRCIFMRRTLKLWNLLQKKRWVTVEDIAQELQTSNSTAREWFKSAEKDWPTRVDTYQGPHGLPTLNIQLMRR